MTTETLEQDPSAPSGIFLTVAAAVVAAALGYEIGTVTTPESFVPPQQSIIVRAPSAQPGSDAYDGTDREVRQLTHRNSPLTSR